MPELETLRSFYTSLKAIFKKTKMTNMTLFANFDDDEDMHYCSCESPRPKGRGFFF